jgi:hypothetical protein
LATLVSAVAERIALSVAFSTVVAAGVGEAARFFFAGGD